MKKKTINLLILLAVLAVLAVGYVALDFLPEKTEEEVLEEPVKITDYTAEDISFYCYSNPEYEIGFHVSGEEYVHYKEENFPVNASGVSLHLSKLETLNALQIVEGTDKAEYGLDVPKYTVAVTLTDGTEHTYFIGDAALFEDADYLLDVEKNVIYLVESGFASAFDCNWSSMVAQEEKVLVSSDQILDITVETGGEVTAYISRDESRERPWQLMDSGKLVDGDSEAVINAVSIFNSYSLGNTVEYACKDFSEYGLDNPAMTVTVRYREQTEDSTEEKVLLFEFGASNEETAEIYARINKSDYVYGMSEYNTEKLSLFPLEELVYTEETAEE